MFRSPGLTSPACSGSCTVPVGNQCPAGSTSASSSVPCGAGEFSVGGDQPCTQCPPGTYRPWYVQATTPCIPCSASTYSNVSGTTTDACPLTCNAPYGMECPAGSASPTTLRVCPAGQYSSANRRCQLCSIGTWGSPAGLQGCTACPANGLVCPAGSTSPALATPCPVGRYAVHYADYAYCEAWYDPVILMAHKANMLLLVLGSVGIGVSFPKTACCVYT